MCLQVNLNLILDISCAWSAYKPLRGWGWTCWVRLYSPLLTNWFSEEDPDFVPEDVEYVAALHPIVPVYSGPPQSASMVWYFDEALEAFAIVVWSLAFVLFLVALALPCPLCRRDVRDWTTCCNKCVISLLGLVFVSHLVTSDEGTLQFPHKNSKCES
jgi:hypothetical protein